MDILGLVYWNNEYNSTLLINFILVIGLFLSIRILASFRMLVMNILFVNTRKELTVKDNPAFAISLVATIFSVAVILVGATYGNPVYSTSDSIVAIGLYGVLGILLIALTRVIFDELALPEISIKDEILKGNIAAGIIDAGNVIATAVIISVVMMWVGDNSVDGVSALIIGYVISQALLTFATYFRTMLFFYKNDKSSLQKSFKKGNRALALRFSGHKIATAFVMVAATNVISYEFHDVGALFLAWIVISLIMLFVLSVVSLVADKVILWKIDANDEVVNKAHTAIGAIQAITYISLSIILINLI